jgi:type I restriction-modification system DNA methylase subunit
MAKPEANFDIYIHALLNEAEITFTAQGSTILEVNNALKHASKKGTGKIGYPEIVAQSKDFLIVMENKADRSKLELLDDDQNLDLSQKAIENYALNGAFHYAKIIAEKTTFKKIFAFGNCGDKKHHILKPIFVDAKGEYKELPPVETFNNFSENNIKDYYSQMVLGEIPPEEKQLAEILKKAATLHEHLRNYGSLGEDEKPLVVSAILLALREQGMGGFSLDSLTGDDVETDGNKLFNQIENQLTRVRVSPEVKKEKVLNQFTLIKDRPILNTKKPELSNKTPLRFYADFINNHIYNTVIADSSEDYLGKFYGEFVSYSGGDGQSLGVVMTPHHITQLFCELLEIKPDDIVFDPCCGTGGFLISAMHRMLSNADTDFAKSQIKQYNIHGIESREDMFAIATTNMILRGDGQSNLVCGDFLGNVETIVQLKGINVGLMNPPYSQAKDATTRHLSEICFTRHLLNSLVRGGRAAVIVPLSTMVGKTREDKIVKDEILSKHTLEGVISLNLDTFFGVGTIPCIALFTAYEPHQKNKIVKFINFEDDGYIVKPHQGLVKTERAKDRKKLLLDCWFGKRTDYPSKFMVETTIENSDEWLHSFYYYNDEIPSEEDFMNSIADYLTFEFKMVVSGKEHLFKEIDYETKS